MRNIGPRLLTVYYRRFLRPIGPSSCVWEDANIAGWKSLSGENSPACDRRLLRRREAGWRAVGGERPVRNARIPMEGILQ